MSGPTIANETTGSVGDAAPLAGIRVLDFTHVLAGPFCTRLLADFGADVVRVESSLRPDRLGAGTWKPGYEDQQDRPAAYMSSNRSKRSLTINLKARGGVALATRLASVADVVVENFSAGVMARLKLDYAALSQVNPRVIVASMAGYGQEGPRRDWVSMNVNLQGSVGLMMVTGAAGDPPIAIGNSWCDYVGGLTTCFAIMQALLDRETTGVGANLDVAQFEANVGPLGALLTGALLGAGLPPRMENRSLTAVPQGCYPCAGDDDWVAISIETDRQWQALVGVLGNPPALLGERFSTPLGRIAGHEIDVALTGWTQARPAVEVERILKATGVPAERVRKIEQVVDEPDGARVFHSMLEPRIGEMLVTGLPFSLAADGLPGPYPAPRLGQHTDEVLHEWLGLSDGEIEELRAEVLV